MGDGTTNHKLVRDKVVDNLLDLGYEVRYDQAHTKLERSIFYQMGLKTAFLEWIGLYNLKANRILSGGGVNETDSVDRKMDDLLLDILEMIECYAAKPDLIQWRREELAKQFGTYEKCLWVRNAARRRKL